MNTIKKVFIHRDGHLRSTLQIIIASLTFLLTSMIGQDKIARLIYELTQNNILPANIYDSYFLTGILPETFLNFVAGFLILILYRIFNKKQVSTMGVTFKFKNIKTIFMGMLTLTVILSSITAVLLLIGDVKFTGLQFSLTILQYILLMASVSFVEEVLNRGFIQHLVRSRSSVFWSLIIPSLVFTSFHVSNPGITVLSLCNIFLAGFFFSLMTYKIGNIWFAFGAHIVWNVGAACIFGLMEVSKTTGSILNFEYARLTLFNGYGVGPLSGLVGTVFWIVAIILFSKINIKRVNLSEA